MYTLHVDSGREMRGGQWQVLYLLEGLREADHEICLLARRGTPLYEKASALRIDTRPLTLAGLSRMSGRADLVHVHDARSHSLAALAARAPVVVSRRVAFPVATGILSRWKYGHAAQYVAISNHVAGMLRAAGVPAERISVIHDGIPLPPEPVPLDSRKDGFIVAPATADPAKGSDLLEKAAAVAGIHVHFSGNLWDDLRSARLFAYITRQEGLGSAVLIAMASGVPVVASRVGGLPELIEHEVTGLLTDNQPEAIAAALGRLLDDLPFARILAGHARARVEQRFSAARMVSATVRVYERVLGC